jgi:hypothetical protein
MSRVMYKVTTTACMAAYSLLYPGVLLSSSMPSRYRMMSAQQQTTCTSAVAAFDELYLGC